MMLKDNKKLIITVLLLTTVTFSCKSIDLQDEPTRIPVNLKVATFNTGNYSGKDFENGSEEGRIKYRALFEELNADIIGLQEDVDYYGNFPAQDLLLDMYPYFYRKGNSYLNYYAFSSNNKILGIKPVYYSGASFNHPFFLTGLVSIGERIILAVSFHFDWADNNRRLLQIKQVIEYASSYEYSILMGDTNCDNYVEGKKVDDTILYEEEWSYFSTAGYSMANNGQYGLFDTIISGKPLDNIFVKGLIDITNAYCVKKDFMNDHYVVCADLLIK